jgi:hypothetical protein
MTMANAIKRRNERRQATRAALARDSVCDSIGFSVSLDSGYGSMYAASAEPPECFRVSGDGGPKHSSVFSDDRVGIPNVYKLVRSHDHVLRGGRAREADLMTP